MSNAIFGWDNHLLSAALTAGSEAAELPVSNLATEHGDPASSWQTATGVLTAAGGGGAWFAGDTGDPNAKWRAFCLARSNLTSSARVRWRVGEPDSVLQRTPTLMLDLSPDFVLPAGASFTRSSKAWYWDSAGNLTEAAANQLRLSYNPVGLAYLGALFEPQRTNSIRNPRGEGAAPGTPGTLPTNWSITTLDGLTQEVVRTGTVSGIPYVDIRVSGTPTADNTRAISFEGNTQVAAASGQTWTGSVFVRLHAGSTANVAFSLRVASYSSAGALLAGDEGTTAVDLSTGILRTQRFAVTRTFTNGATAFCNLALLFSYTAGNPVDFTLRIGIPQLEQGPFATTPILGNAGAPAAYTRTHESFVWSPGGDFANSPGGGALLAEYIVSIAATSTTVIARLDDGTDNNAVFIRVRGGPAADAILAAVDGTWHADLNDLAITPGTTCRTVVTWTDSHFTGATNGTAHNDDTTIVPPSALTRLQLPQFTTHQIYMRRVVVYNPELGAASLLQASIDGSTLAGTPAYDSGWLDDGITGAAAQRVHVAPAEVAGQCVRCDIDDPSNPDGFVRVALAYAGPAWQPRFNIHPETAFAPERVAREARTRGGQTWYELLWTERAWEVSHQWTEDAEVWAQLMAMEQAAALGRNVLFVPFPASPDANREAVFGPMKLLSPVGFIAPGTKLRTWRARFSERL